LGNAPAIPPVYAGAMLFVVLLEDDPVRSAEIRRRAMPAHLLFLARHAGAITAAGPLRQPDGAAAGGIWIVTAEAPEAVDALVREDPFWAAGLRRSVRILEWTRVWPPPQGRA
jgi:uncharacterized protein YciI